MSTLPVRKQLFIDVFIFITVFLPLTLLHALGKPAIRGFWCNDWSLGYPYKEDTVSMALLMVFTFVGPFFVMAVTEAIRAAAKLRLFRHFCGQMLSLAKAYGVFLFGMTVTLIFTESIKYSVGRLRPHFFDVCKPDFDKINCTSDVVTDRFIVSYRCTNRLVDERLIQDSHLSFPSGHASMSLFSAVFTLLYLESRMDVNFSYLLKPALQMAMVLLASFCCVTRVTDNKHFTSDVIAGVVIGVSLAWVTFYRIGKIVIPTQLIEKPPRLPRATSIESEPQTPTPLLRPERLIITHNYRNSPGPASKDNFPKTSSRVFYSILFRMPRSLCNDP